jgi:BMFP domain-containing protein YqiC
MSLSAGDIVRLLKSDRDALRELAVINAVLADVATKQDINQLREEMRGEITSTKQEIQQLRQELREEIAQLRQHVDSEIAQLRREMKDEISQLRRDMSTNFRWTIGLIIGIWGMTVIPLLMKMAGII